MGFKLILLFFIIVLINWSAGQRHGGPILLVTPRRLFTRATMPPYIVPAFTNCTQYSTSREYWIQFPNSRYCYLYPGYYDYAENWQDAYEKCRKKKATLLSIHDDRTNYILSHPRTLRGGVGGVYWIGLNSLNGQRGLYKWSDRSPVDVRNFALTTSNGDRLPPNIKDQGRCVSIRVVAQSYIFKSRYTNVGQWFKEDCGSQRQYICQRNSSSPPPLPPMPTGGCPAGWYNANQKCIKYMSTPMTFDQARKSCQSFNNGGLNNPGDLLSIDSEGDQNFITAMTAGLRAPLIGISHANFYTRWNWTDQYPVTYTNWGIQQPINYYHPRNCAVVVTNSTQPGKWLWVNCTEKHPYLCEVDRATSAKSGTDFLAKTCLNWKPLTGSSTFTAFRQSCYTIVGTSSSFSDADKQCRAMGQGSHLVSIVDAFEQSFLKYFISQKGKSNMYLTGLQSKGQSDSNDTQMFEWTDSWPVYYTDWMKNEPKAPRAQQDQCVIITNIKGSIGSWKTVDCSTPYPYICKVNKKLPPLVNGGKSGVCPKLVGNTDSTLNWVNLHKGLQNCFWFSTERKGIQGSSGLQSWSDASFHCRRRNGTLATIQSSDVQTILMNRLKNNKYFTSSWIGLSRDPEGDLIWEDGSSIDYTNWAPGERYKNISDLNDDSGNVCVEMSWDMTWKQTACNGNKRNFFVCQTKKLFSPSNNGVSQSSTGSGDGHKGRTAGIVIGVLLAIVALVGIGIYVVRKNNLKIPGNSFDNPLNRSQRGEGIKPQNSNPSTSSLTQNGNDNPFAKNSFE